MFVPVIVGSIWYDWSVVMGKDTYTKAEQLHSKWEYNVKHGVYEQCVRNKNYKLTFF